MAGSNARRRSVLKSIAGVATAGSLAGCLGGGDGDGGDGSGDGSDGGGGDGGSQDDFPTDDLRLIIMASPGGGYDEYARITARHLTDHVATNVVPENMAGAGGQVATEFMYNDAQRDGHTLMILNAATAVRRQVLEDVSYDMSGFTYYPQVVEDVQSVVVGTNSGIETWDQFVEAVNAGELTFATRGPTTSASVIPAFLGELGGLWPIDRVIDNSVAYAGTAEAITGIEQGEADVHAGPLSSLAQYVEADILDFLIAGVMEDSVADVLDGVSQDVAELPTFGTENIQNGQEIIDLTAGRRIFVGPPEVPEGPVEYLRDAFDETLQSDAFLADAEEAGRPVIYRNSEDTGQSMTTALEQWEQQKDLLDQLQQ